MTGCQPSQDLCDTVRRVHRWFLFKSLFETEGRPHKTVRMKLVHQSSVHSSSDLYLLVREPGLQPAFYTLSLPTVNRNRQFRGLVVTYQLR